MIDGIPYAMSPAPTPKHQIIGANLLAEFRIALKKCSHRKASQPVDNKVTEVTVLQPDVLIICKEIKSNFLDFPPALVVEILSPSTALKDRHTKFTLYQQESIPYYLIVSPDTEQAEIYVLEKQEYLLKEKGRQFSYTFQFEEACSATIDFGELWK